MESAKDLCFWIVVSAGAIVVLVGAACVCLNLIIRLVRNEIKRSIVAVDDTAAAAAATMELTPDLLGTQPAPKRKKATLKPGEIPCPVCHKRAVSAAPLRVEADGEIAVAIHGCGKCGEVRIPLQAPSPAA